jgi:hypothetical protein
VPYLKPFCLRCARSPDRLQKDSGGAIPQTAQSASADGRKMKPISGKSSGAGRYKTLRYVSDGLIILVILGGLWFFLQYPEKLDALLDWMVGHR